MNSSIKENINEIDGLVKDLHKTKSAAEKNDLMAKYAHLLKGEVINNTLWIDQVFVQRLIECDQDQVYHLIHYILTYADAFIDKTECQDDVKELLHETLLLIGYYCLQNE